MRNTAYIHFSNRLSKGFYEATGPRSFKNWLGNVVDTFYPNNEALNSMQLKNLLKGKIIFDY